jgi:voltage-gated potassium channel
MEYLKKNRFLLFMILLFMAIAHSMFSQDPKTLELLSTINFTLILASGLWAFFEHQNFLRFTSIFFIIAIILEWLQYLIDGPALNNIQPLTTSLVLILLLVMTLKRISAAREVDQNVIFGVVSGYVLIGFIGGLMALAIARTIPEAFNVEGIISWSKALYYSFVTMTTLGYGDILPTIEPTRSLSIILSIVGPMYVAIIVALMVGKFASRKN